MSPGERLVYMANQIARNFEIAGADRAAAATAEHIESYWDPLMKRRILENTEGLDPVAATAIGLLKERKKDLLF